MSSIVKITPTRKVLLTFSRNFPPAKITTFTVYGIYILKINENAMFTCIFDIFPTWTCQSKFCFHQTIILYIFYQKIILHILIYCQYALFKSTWSKTSYLTPYNVLHEWFVLLHRALLAYWVDNIFPTSKCGYVFSISKCWKICKTKVQWYSKVRWSR